MKTLEEVKEYITERYDEDVIVYDSPSYAEAFIGISNDNRAIYSYNKMIDWLMKEDKISEEEAVEFIDYNTLGAYYSDKQPIVCFDID